MIKGFFECINIFINIFVDIFKALNLKVFDMKIPLLDMFFNQ